MSGGHKCYAWVKPAAVKKIARLLEFCAVPRTVYEIAEHLPLSKRTVVAYLGHLRGEAAEGEDKPERRLRVAAWPLSPDTGHHMAAFQVGAEPDAPKPKGRTAAKRKRDLRKRLKREDPDEALRRRRVRQEKRRGVRRDPMIAAFFGAPQ